MSNAMVVGDKKKYLTVLLSLKVGGDGRAAAPVGRPEEEEEEDVHAVVMRACLT